MAGIISLLEGGSAVRIRDLMERMTAEFGVLRGFPGGEPHISYHLGDYAGDASVSGRIEALARAAAPFHPRVSGFGVFSGPSPVVYLAVARSPQLAGLHQAVRLAMAGLGFPNNPYYEPDAWLPHITIAQQNLPPGTVRSVLQWLAGLDLQFYVDVTNLTIAKETPDSLDALALYRMGVAD